MQTAITGIKLLAGITPAGAHFLSGAKMDRLGTIENAYLIVRDGVIADFGPMDEMPSPAPGTEVIDAEGGMVLPCFCDSHTHIVYAGTRDAEFLDKIRGLSYEEIARRGGGILNSAALLHQTSEDELFEASLPRVYEAISKGTGAMEIKSGYGLNVGDELKMLRVIARISETVPAIVRATFLGAHAVPSGMTREEYVRVVCEEMIPSAAGEGLAEFVDVFCDQGFFTPEDTLKIAETGMRYGMRAKIHANELGVSGGVQAAIKAGALSADHLERTTEAEILAFKEAFASGSGPMPTFLPGSSFFLGIPFGNARGYIDAGLPIALASDRNPGSSPSGDMRFVMALGCIRQKLTPSEALAATTINSAYAMGISNMAGSIERGKVANLILTLPLRSLNMPVYEYTSPFIRTVFLHGRPQ